ncbi:glycosyl hydrolase 108 family protein [Azorhizobium sp. AG788]|uniref:glycosyl hydrolase 108 family protein n=1 Tax=Azorhizobium sp. AG788 TaxID=2183897 RepID=UPI00313A2E89
MGASGEGILALARKHLGEIYKITDTSVPKDDPDWRGPWDCAEFISWLVYQESGTLYGCLDNTSSPSKANAYTGSWKRDANTLGKRISVEDAAAIPGAVLLRYPPTDGAMGHIVLSDGQGGTVEAMGAKYGVVPGKVSGRRWDTGVLVPGISYSSSPAVEVAGPAVLYAPGAANMDPGTVASLQRALKAARFDPGAIDGVFGKATAEAVAQFQRHSGLVADGEVGATTADALGIQLGAKTSIPAVAALLEGNMNPLIAIAASLFPEVLKLIAGDKVGVITASIGRAVAEATGTDNPQQAREKVASDPAVASDLQVRLAKIAVEQEDKRQAALLEELKLRLSAEQAQDAAAQNNTHDARQFSLELMKTGGPNSWAPFVISMAVFIIFVLLLSGLIALKALQFEVDANGVLGIAIGALVAAFSTVVNFWLGSSQGSRFKDAAAVGEQAERSHQAQEALRDQAKLVQNVQKTTGANAAALAAAAANVATVAAGGASGSTFSNFDKCVEIIIKWEGEVYENDPEDAGGPTKFGVTLEDLTAWRKGQDPQAVVDASSVQKLERKEACEIFRSKYWNRMKCDDLPPGVDLVVFDFGVNAGIGRAATTLQKIVGAHQDGSIGPATVAATKSTDPKAVISRLSDLRREFYENLPQAPRYGKGWINRTNDVEKSALSMAI